MMPSKSPAQARLMAAAAHSKGGYGGVPQSVGKEFNEADTGSAMLSKAMRGGDGHKLGGKMHRADSRRHMETGRRNPLEVKDYTD